MITILEMVMEIRVIITYYIIIEVDGMQNCQKVDNIKCTLSL